MTCDLKKLAGSLTNAQRRALLAMTERPEFPGKATFTAGGAWEVARFRPSIAEGVWVTIQTARSSKQRQAFYLTRLALRAHLQDNPHD